MQMGMLYSQVLEDFDARGNETVRTFFDEAGKPISLTNGYATSQSTFDARGNQTKVAFFDEAGKPISTRDGYASWQSTFDAPRGREQEFADLVGKGVYEGGFDGLRAFLRRRPGTLVMPGVAAASPLRATAGDALSKWGPRGVALTTRPRYTGSTFGVPVLSKNKFAGF